MKETEFMYHNWLLESPNLSPVKTSVLFSVCSFGYNAIASSSQQNYLFWPFCRTEERNSRFTNKIKDHQKWSVLLNESCLSDLQ